MFYIQTENDKFNPRLFPLRDSRTRDGVEKTGKVTVTFGLSGYRNITEDFTRHINS